MRSSHGPLKLFVGDIGHNHKSDLKRLFSKYGEISTIYIDENKHFAFVEFTSSSDAKYALEHAQNKTLNGSKLRVEYAKSDKPRDVRHPSSRGRSPTSTLYSHLEVTANRLPPRNAFRQNYYQYYPWSIPTTHSSTKSRGRSLTPPSFKRNSRLPSMHHLPPQDLYYNHPTMCTDPSYYRAYADPYLVQRLPPSGYLPPTPPPSSSSSSSRSHRNIYSSSGMAHHTSETSTKSHQGRSRSRPRVLQSHRDRSSRERKRKRRTSSISSNESNHERGPRTPPLKSIKHCSRTRSQSHSDVVSLASNQKSLSDLSSSSSEDEEKQSNSKQSTDNNSDKNIRTEQL